MLRVGLTGGVASGKSTVAALFAGHGVPVIDTDVIAREVVKPGRPALAALVATQGPSILDAAGRLDRAKLRDRLFADPAVRREVEGILHPDILRELQRRSTEAGGPYQVFVIPLLVEAKLEDVVDRILVVDCSEEEQLRRLMARDGETRADAGRMLAAQASRAERLAAADDVIENNGDAADLPAQVDRLDRKYRQLTAKVYANGSPAAK